MKAWKKVIIFSTSLLIFFSAGSSLVSAQGWQNVGTHITNGWTRDGFLQELRAQMGHNDWVPVTLSVNVNEGNLNNLANRLSQNNFYPIIRVTGDWRGGHVWGVPSSGDLRSAAQRMSSIFTPDKFGGRKPTAVVLNEINMAREWGGQQVDPVAYSQLLAAFIQGNNGNLQVAVAPINTSLPPGQPNSLEAAAYIDGMDQGILNQVDIVACNSYPLGSCAFENDQSRCSLNSCNWQAVAMGLEGKPKILTEFGPDPSNTSQYYSRAEGVVSADYGGYFAATPLIRDLCNPVLDWGITILNGPKFLDYDFEELSDECIMADIASLDDILENNQETRAGRRVYGRGIPCGPLSSRPGPNEDQVKMYYDISPEEKEEKGHPYSAMDFIPYDWSPERPFPGDSCYAIEDTTQSQYSTEYCAEDPVGIDVAHYFGEGRAINYPQETDLHLTITQVPFLGNSNASGSQYVHDNEQRIGTFITDYYRGTLFFDRAWEGRKDVPWDRMVKETGVIRKLYPHNYTYNDEPANSWKENDFMIERLLKATFGIYPGPLEGPVHDYPLIYMYSNGHIVPKGEFDRKFSTGLTDRRSYENIFPIRMSQLLCQGDAIGIDGDGNGVPDVYDGEGMPGNPCAQGTNWQAGGVSKGDETLLYGELWPKYFPLGSKEDVRAIVDYSMFFAGPVGDPIKFDDEFFKLSRDEQNFILEETPGIYGIGGDMGIVMHRVEEVFIPYIAETEDLSEWIFNAVHSYDQIQKAEDSDFSDPSLDNLKLPRSESCTFEEARGGPGDPVAIDYDNYWHQLEAPGSPIFLGEKLVWGGRTIMVDDCARAPVCESSYNEETQLWETGVAECPTPCSKDIKTTGSLKTKIPLIKTVAARTIGEKNGFYNIFFTNEQLEKIKEKLGEKAGGKVNPLEFPAVGKASFSWMAHGPNFSSGEMCGMYCEDGEQNAESVSSRGDQVDFYFPYLGALDIYNKLSQQVLLPRSMQGGGVQAEPVEGEPLAGGQLGECSNMQIEEMHPETAGYLRRAAEQEGVPFKVLAAVLYIEGKSAYTSANRSCAQSPCGAFGWFQILCGAENVNCDPNQGRICDPYCENGSLKPGVEDLFACPAGITDAQQLCDPGTAAVEAAKKLNGKKAAAGGGEWDADLAGEVGARYYGESDTYNGNCSNGTGHERLGNCTYCEFVREFYKNF
jgi:hypothetical protein